MSDGYNEGARWARRSDDRQRKIDDFFAETIQVVRDGREIDGLKPAFMIFDAMRYADHLARGRLERTKNSRWAAFRKMLVLASSGELQSWAGILALALEHATPSLAIRLQALATPFATGPIALYVPGGPGREPTLFGNHASLLDEAAAGRGRMIVLKIDDPVRAIVGLEVGDETKDFLEPERSQLRLLAYILS